MSVDLKILLVEDEAPKRDHVHKLIADNFPDCSIFTAMSVNSALEYIEDIKFDLILLDMSLPTFDVGDRESGGRPQGFGGREILRFIQMSEIQAEVVVVTGYEGFTREDGVTLDISQLREELFSEFPSELSEVIHYNSALDSWKKIISELISKKMRKGG